MIATASEGDRVRQALRDHGHASAGELGIAHTARAALADSLRREYDRANLARALVQLVP